jgi:putative transposase
MSADGAPPSLRRPPKKPGLKATWRDDNGLSEDTHRFVNRTYVYRLKLRSSQHARLDACLESQRLLYNAALQERQSYYRWSSHKRQIGQAGDIPQTQSGTPKMGLSYQDQTVALTQVRESDARYGDQPVNLSRFTLHQLDAAMKGFFQRCQAGKTPGFPRYKAMGRFRCMGFTEFSGIRLEQTDSKWARLSIYNVCSNMRVHLHRPLPAVHTITRCWLQRSDLGWKIGLQILLPLERRGSDVYPGSTIQENEVVGGDVGIESYLTLSDGTVVPNPRLYDRCSPGIRKLQRRLSAKKKGSRSFRQVRRQLRGAHRRLVNARKDYAHKVSRQLDDGPHRLMALEDLSLPNMTASAKGTVEDPGRRVRQKAGLNRSLLDCAPGRLRDLVAYKAESAGKLLIAVPPAWSSQICSGCGEWVPKELGEREHACKQCGLTVHRDLNAALNCKAWGLQLHRGGRTAGFAALRSRRAPGGRTAPVTKALSQGSSL